MKKNIKGSIINFSARITLDSVSMLLIMLYARPAPHIVTINSLGGYAYFFPAIAPTIQGMKVTTVAYSAHSAAALLFVLGHKRVVHEHSTMLFHPTGLELKGQVITKKDLDKYEQKLKAYNCDVGDWFVARQKQLSDEQEKFINFFTYLTACPRSVIRCFVEESRTLNGEEMLNLGIATNYIDL